MESVTHSRNENYTNLVEFFIMPVFSFIR